ncbi:hypothetical protein MKX03_004898, partial [Papaver bracteatum]
ALPCGANVKSLDLCKIMRLGNDDPENVEFADFLLKECCVRQARECSICILDAKYYSQILISDIMKSPTITGFGK